MVKDTLPTLKHIIAVEPDAQFNQTIQDKFQPYKHRPLKVRPTFLNKKVKHHALPHGADMNAFNIKSKKRAAFFFSLFRWTW